MRSRECYALQPDQCHPGPASPKPPRIPCLPLPSCGNPPESPRHERASISVRLGGLGFISGWLDAEDKIFMQISLSFQMPIRIWNYSEKQTDNRREIYSELLAHSEQIHSARRYLSTHFFINFNWFIKITRSFGSGFQSQNIAKPKVRLIIIENKSEADNPTRSD